MIYLLCSTIRPETFITTHNEWMDKCKYPQHVRTKVIIDSAIDRDVLVNYDVMLYQGDSVGITKPLTTLTMSLQNSGLSDEDIIVVMSDDFFPPADWDVFLLDQFSNFDGALNVYDGGPPAVQDNLITIPIMTYGCLKKLNYIVYNPAYTHMYSDNELFDILTGLNAIKRTDKAPEHTFEHRHWTTKSRQKDETDSILGKISSTDHAVYIARKKMSIAQRLQTDFNPTPIVLSILICTIEGRETELRKLMTKLSPQLKDSVELLILSDNREVTIGKKRDDLLKLASGKYVCFVDDDDMVSADYVDSILYACEYNADCVGIRGVYVVAGRPPKDFVHSVVHKDKGWHETKEAYFRTPNHLNPIKRSIALKVGFNPDRAHAEDLEFSNAVAPLLETEYYMPNVIYKYQFNPRK